MTDSKSIVIQPLIEYWNDIHPMTQALVNDIIALTKVQSFSKGEMLLVPGKTANYASFILEGLAKSYYIRETDMAEVVTKFMHEKSIITSIFSYFGRKPGNEYIVALEDTLVTSLHYDDMQKLFKVHPVFNTIIRVTTERYLYFSEVELYNMRKPLAEDRYNFFLKHFPHLLQRLALKDVASYLGMTVETLSRVRGKFRKIQ
jgi:CRP/FNR family transcriptional regulator, anaerobic regulatory protein